MPCAHCGAPLQPTSRFCPTCGNLVDSTVSPGRPTLTLSVQGPSGPTTHSVAQGRAIIGRATDSTIPLPHDQVSRHHAEIVFDASGCCISDLGSTNGTFLNGTRLAQQRAEPLHDGDVIQVGPFTLSIALDLAFQVSTPGRLRPSAAPAAVSPIAGHHISARGAAPAAPPTARVDLRQHPSVRIGRAQDNDLIIPHPQASRYHAVLEKAGDSYRLTDLGSTNGTILNGKRITASRSLREGDVIQIASARFVLREGQFEQFDDQGNITVDALHLVKTVGKGQRILSDVSLSIRPKEFVAIVGGSGAGKSTLLNALNGFRPATEGAVLYNGVDLYEQFDAFRNVLGYVPQDDIIHRELTVAGALDYAAQLRLPRDTTGEERRQRIDEVMSDLGLESRRDTTINQLSGGQRKRVSIGVELLTKPSLFFLDEPTSGLDPSTETKMMRMLREMADQGRTVILVTHVTGNVSLCDKVIIMARGGRLAFFGPPEAALEFFQVRDFVDIYDRLDESKPEEIEANFEGSAQYRDLIAAPLSQYARPAAGRRSDRAAPGFKRISALRQFIILSRRNLDILVRDRASLVLMLMLAPVIGVMDFFTWKPTLFDSKDGNAPQVITMLFMAGLITILVGSIASMREIVRETDIYRRERMVGLGILPYILSKVWLGAILALYQALILVVVKAVAVPSMPHDSTTLILIYVTLALATLSGMLSGLFVSAVSPNQNVAPLLIILFLIPQFLFSGGLLPTKTLPGGEIVSQATATKWTFETLVTITGAGKEVAQDLCWQLPAALADDPRLAADYAAGKFDDGNAALKAWQNSKDETFQRLNCQCLGPRVFGCAFPGIQKQYSSAVDQPEPVKPPKPGEPPPDPSKAPAAPAAPPARPNCNQQEAACQQQLKDWNTAMDDWNASMTTWKNQMDDWKSEMDNWQDRMTSYKDENNVYKTALEDWGTQDKDWQEKRTRAIGNAEGLIRKLYEDYGGTFNSDVYRNWGALGIIMGVLVVLIFAVQKYKDYQSR